MVNFLKIIIAGFCLLLLSSHTVKAQKKHPLRKHYFFAQISPNLQQPLQISESPHHNLKQSVSWGAGADIGYHFKVYKNFGINASIGGDLFSYVYTSGKNDFLKLDIPGVLADNGEIYFRWYPYAYHLHFAVTYFFALKKKRALELSLGCKLLKNEIDSLEHGVSYYIPPEYEVFRGRMGFKNSVVPVITIGISTPVRHPLARFSIGLLMQISPTPIGTGKFIIQNTKSNSTGATLFYGNSLGLNFIYNFK